MRLSRWTRAAYDTDADLAKEAHAFEGLVEVLPMRQDAEIVVVNSGLPVGPALLKQVPSAQLVITTTSGFDHLDLQALADRGIAAARLPMARRDPVVEQSLAHLLWGLQARGELDAGAAKGTWMRGDLPALAPRLLQGARIGVVGLGVIGTRMAEVLGLLGAQVTGLDPAGVPAGISPAMLREMAQGDAITLHVGLSDTSRGLCDEAFFEGVGPDLVLVNTSRGAVVALDAAHKALVEGRFAALALDVFPTEPPPELKDLAQHARVRCAPHSAGYHRGLAQALREELVTTVGQWTTHQTVPHPVACSVSP